mmetsp:Transcript_20452/g.62258  ORF Transcript_20452/g.62258 Transcript_20452/m.62258 type:complete len:380 (-) Transcript_20452:117-1256(-)
MCLDCSGQHRSLGVHISFVRSVTMDSWTDKQLASMRNGGNQKYQDFLAAQGVRNAQSLSIPEKYNLSEAELYREQLRARVEGRPVPTEVPRRARPPASAARTQGAAVGGGHADVDTIQRLNGESDEQYVARQRRLRDAASRRMKEKFGGGGMAMQGLGSTSGYNPATGSYGGGGGGGGNGALDSVGDQLGSAWNAIATGATQLAGQTQHQLEEARIGETLSTGWNKLSNALSDEQQRSDLVNNVSDSVTSGWSAIATGATSLWGQALAAVDPEAANGGPSLTGGLAPTADPKYAGSGMSSTGNAYAASSSSAYGNSNPSPPAAPVRTSSSSNPPAPADDPWSQVVKTSPPRRKPQEAPKPKAEEPPPPTGDDFFNSFGV